MQTAESLLYSRLVRQIKQANIITINYVYEINFLVNYQQLTMILDDSLCYSDGINVTVEEQVLKIAWLSIMRRN